MRECRLRVGDDESWKSPLAAKRAKPPQDVNSLDLLLPNPFFPCPGKLFLTQGNGSPTQGINPVDPRREY